MFLRDRRYTVNATRPQGYRIDWIDFRGAWKKIVSIGEDREGYIRAWGMNPRIYQERIGYVELKANL